MNRLIGLVTVAVKIDRELKDWLDSLGGNRSEYIRKALWRYYRDVREIERLKEKNPR